MELPAHEELEEFLADLDYLQDMEVCNQLFVFQPEAFNLLVSRIQPADADKFKEELHNATNSQHKFREIFNDYPDVDQWREILRYIHFTCDPTKCRPKYEENREVFYAKQKLCASGTHAAIYKRSTEGKNVRELHNLYEFNLLLNTMEWMMAGEDWLAIQKNGGAGGVQGITNLLSPLEPSNPAGHDYGDGDNYERRRRRDLIAQKFPIKAKTRDPTHTASETKRSKKAKGLLIEQTNAPLPTSPTHAPSISVVSPTTATPAPIEKALDISGATTETLARRLWFESAEKGDVHAMREMLTLSTDSSTIRSWTVDVNWRDERKITALSKAALSMEISTERTETVQLLLQNGADPALQDVCGGCPLYYACCCDQIDILKFLVVHPRIKLNAVQEHGTCSLHIAANLGHVDTVELLLTQKHQLKLNQQLEKNKRTSLMGAITSQGKYHNRLRIARLLLDAGCDRRMVDNEGFTAYMLACQRGQRDVAELIYHYRAAPSTNMTEEDGEEESVQVDTTTAEEEDACSIDLDEDTTFAAFREALFRAAVLGRVDEAGRLLYFAQCDPERRDWIDVNHLDGATTLMVVAQLGYALPSQALAVDVVLRLLTAGADPNIPNKLGQLPLLLAASTGLGNTLHVMDLLIKHGALVNAQNPRKETALAGDTALLAAAQCGNSQAVQFLLQAGADPTLCNDVGLSPLMAAAKCGVFTSVEIMKLLLQSAVVDINARNQAGETALFLATQAGDFEAVHFLLQTAGADPDIANTVLAVIH